MASMLGEVALMGSLHNTIALEQWAGACILCGAVFRIATSRPQGELLKARP